jgi:hypothetical protein
MAEIHDQLESEGIVREGYAAAVRGAFGLPGRLYLTGRRLVFLQTNPLFFAFGAAGAALGVAKKPKNLKLDLPVGEITDVSTEKFGMTRNALTVTSASGEVAKFNVKDNEEWAQALRGGQAPATA